jgi:hypothetical protein
MYDTTLNACQKPGRAETRTGGCGYERSAKVVLSNLMLLHSKVS